MMQAALLAIALGTASAQCTISNVFGSHMVCDGNMCTIHVTAATLALAMKPLRLVQVLQRDSTATVLNGFGKAGDTVAVTLDGSSLPPTTVGADGIWRVSLPSTPASLTPHTLTATCASGGSASLSDVLFGDVFLCGGQVSVIQK